MPEPRKPAPVSAWVFGKLAKEEENDLMSRALEDPALFDELVAANEERAVLENPIYRQRLKRSLQAEARPRGWAAVWAWANRPVSRLALAGVTAGLIAVLIWRGGGKNEEIVDRPASMVTNSDTDLGAYYSVPLREKVKVRFDLNRQPAEYHPGELLHATLHLDAPADVFVLRRQPDGQTRMVFPRDLAASPNLPSGDSDIVFDPLPPTTDVTARQPVRLRVLVLPGGVDLRSGSIDWAKLGPYTVREVTYYVAP
jgi:hypothetical protein